MPKLDLTTALQIKGASGEILQLKGQGFSWGKPLHHPFPLSTPPADMVGFTLDAATDRTATFTRGILERSHIAWPLQFPVGARVRFDWSSENQVYCRTSTNLTVSSVVMTIFSGQSGSGSVDVIITTAAPYFGFVVTNNFPKLPVHITNFTVDLP